MRNLKIGTKIFVVFAIVIALMLLSAAVVLISNLGIIDNVDKIDKDSALQTAGNTLKDDFLLTRVAAIQLLATIDSTVYDSFVRQADTAAQNYAGIYKIIDQDSFLEEFRPAFMQAESDFQVYLAKAHELGQANAEEEVQIGKMYVAEAVMEEYGDLILRDQIELLRQEISAGNVTQDAQVRRVDRIESGADIALNIAAFRMYAHEMMAGFETTHMPIALEHIDKAYSITEAYNQASTIVKNIENSQLLMDSIMEYRTALVEFGVVCERAATISDELGPLGATALNSLSAAVEALDKAMSGQVKSTTVSATSSLIVVMSISLASIIIAIILALIIVRGITVPVTKMVRAADSLSLGDVDVDARYESKDEIGMLSTSFERMLNGIRDQVSVVGSLANCDLTVDINPRSDKDTMGHGLHRMVDNLNDMFSNIDSASNQVATGSRQIAEGAQILAQGSTEQASAVQELSASIAQISAQTRDNADMAGRAAELAVQIKQNAEKGSAQMTHMMQAVREINEASQSISKVIKVIDDIAFQTNILALNAAVEAARAGQHGKGFAVVAEEVRNLAAKSAEAAKDTSGLIENSMEKAEYGSRIAQETANSLSEIVAGINESTRIVTDIARISEEQSASVSQINTGIDQVAQVVQQNSATAEESAAASEQMSGQSDVLRERVAQFKLKPKLDSGDSYRTAFTTPSPRKLALAEHKDLSGGDGFGKY